VKAAIAHAPVHRSLPETDLQQLPAGDDPVLPRRQLGQT
jgi:hypothetical protein